MTWYRRNRQFVAVFVLISIFGVFFSFDNPVKRGLSGGMRATAAIAWEARHSAVEAFNSYGGIASRIELAKEKAQLKMEIDRLQTLSLHNDVLRGENEVLRGMLKLREAHPKGLSAPVLSNPSVSPYGTFVVGSGSEDGVTVGAHVLSAPRVAIGKVLEVDSHTALVGLFSTPGKRTEIMMGKTRLQYIGRGDGNGLVIVPRGVSVSEGDAVQLPGLPFAIGFAGFIKSDPEDAQTTVLVRVPANLPSLSFVQIVPETAFPDVH